MKFKEKLTAIKLRKQGHGYSFILKKIKVSKSTLSLWLRNIELTKIQKKLLLKGLDISRAASAKKRKELKNERILYITKAGEKEFVTLTKSPLFLPGLSLYWAEGDKNQQERIKFTNSDPKMITFMMRWFREICKIPEKKFRIALHIHTLHMKRDIKRYWMNITNLPKEQFHKLYIKPTSLGQRRNILYNGTCAIVINNKDLFRRIMGWKEGLIEYFKK